MFVFPGSDLKRQAALEKTLVKVAAEKHAYNTSM